MDISNTLLIQFGTAYRDTTSPIEYHYATSFSNTNYCLVVGFEYGGSNGTMGYREIGYKDKTTSSFTNESIVTNAYQKYMTWIAIGC